MASFWKWIVPLVTLVAVVSAKPAKKQPHILLVVADDYGFNDIGYHQNNVSSANPLGKPTTNAAAGILQTPTLDKLAAEGVKCENYYVQPLCSPTRSTIMTGRYPSHTGAGPDVIRIDWPYGVPGREKMLPEGLKNAGYDTHMVGKWHLGTCDERYMPTFRGFDSYMGYLSGAESYYNHGGDRNGTGTDKLVPCMGANFTNNYSSVLWANEVSRIVTHHDQTKPLFIYLAFQSVHNPYDVPPIEFIDINKTFPEIVDYERRIYAGMVTMLDLGVAHVVSAYEAAGMWDDTVLVFTSDNGGIGPGSNFPLRGMKVLNWEGGLKAVGFVRGTNSDLAKIPTNTVTHELMHSTDWLPTLVALGGGVPPGTLPLDGHNQWDVLANGAKTNRTTIFHNVPVGAKPVMITVNNKSVLSSSSCMYYVDPRVGSCHPFGVTGGAMRSGDFKLLITFDGHAPWEDTSPPGIAQYTPGGRYPNGTAVFVPEIPTSIPAPYNGTYFLFDISKDPSETNNLAESMPNKLKELVDMYDEYAATHDVVSDLSWRYGFDKGDPHKGNNPPFDNDKSFFSTPVVFNPEQVVTLADPKTCEGPFIGSQYCHFGEEFLCFVSGLGLTGNDVSSVAASNRTECQERCQGNNECQYWVFDSTTSTDACKLKSAMGPTWTCSDCSYGPKNCPK